jgi:hypothetical protein
MTGNTGLMRSFPLLIVAGLLATGCSAPASEFHKKSTYDNPAHNYYRYEPVSHQPTVDCLDYSPNCIF